jgi:hypothetical protein
MSRRQHLVLRTAGQSRTVTREHHPPRQVPQPQPQHRLVRQGATSQTIDARLLSRIQSLDQRMPIQQRLHRGMRHQDRLGGSLRQAPPTRVRPIVPSEDHPQQHHRNQADRRIDRKRPTYRPRRRTPRLHAPGFGPSFPRLEDSTAFASRQFATLGPGVASRASRRVAMCRVFQGPRGTIWSVGDR